VERTVPLKALVSEINYNLFDMEVGTQQSQFAYLQAKDLADAVDGLLRTHDVSLWNGNDTSLIAPTTPQYFGAIGQIEAGGNTVTIGTTASIVDGLKSTIAEMVASSSFDVRPTAIYANPVLLDLIDREMKTEFNVVLSTVQITGGITVKALSTQAGELPLIPEWALPYTGTPGSGSAVLPAYIVSEDMIEYHWLTDPNPRVFQAGAAERADYAERGREIRRGRRERRELCALRSAGEPVRPVASTQLPVASNKGRWQLVTHTYQREPIMNYLQPSEYELYGLEATTAVAWVTAASAVIDAHCKRITLAVNQYTERCERRTDRGRCS